MNEEERAIVEGVARFVDREVRPQADTLEQQGLYPDALVKKAAELGLFGIAVPAEFGGLGLSLPAFVAAMEEVARGWTTLAAYINSHATVASAIRNHGTDGQRSRYLPRMATGELRGAICLTEDTGGSDLQAIRTVAKQAGDGYVIAGTKIFVTNGDKAGLLLVLVKTDPAAKPAKDGMSLFLVDKQESGVSASGTYHKMGFDLVDTCEIKFEDIKVPSVALLGGKPGRGLAQILDGLDTGRLAIAASANGLAIAALDESIAYSRQRRAFGTEIAGFQAIQFRLAEMASRTAASRAMTAEAARAKAEGRSAGMLCAMAKLVSSEAAFETVTDAVRVHGGYGYIRTVQAERLFREAPLYIVGEGTNDIQKIVIARSLLQGKSLSELGLAG